jgi:hypothetical protein
MTEKIEVEVREYAHQGATRGFKNFSWTPAALDDWETVWGALWYVGVKWEWQNGDRYARRRGDTFNLFGVHDDAMRLDMALPLPEIGAIIQMLEWLNEAHIDNHTANEAINLLRKWMREYVE